MNIFTKGFSKPDEMEAAISYQATRITWNIVNTLFVLGVFWSLAVEQINPISGLALLLAEAIYFTIKVFLRWRLTRGGKDNE